MTQQHTSQRQLSTDCEHGTMCVDDRPGHAMSLLRLRLALASRSGWVDAVVRSTDESGWIELELWQSGDVVSVWHHSAAPLAQVGSPVSLHEAYSVLAAGTHRLNVAL